MPSIERDNMAGLIPEPVTREIFQGVVEQSAVLRVGRKLPNMTAKTQAINVLDMLPLAYWVDGDTGFKQTAAQAWDKKKLYAEELAVIIPIPEAVLPIRTMTSGPRSGPASSRPWAAGSTRPSSSVPANPPPGARASCRPPRKPEPP